MSKSEKPEWVLRSLFLVVPSSVLSCLLTLWVASPTASAPPPQSEANTGQALQEIAELLRDQTDQGLRATDPVQLARSEREPISESGTEEMSDLIGRLEHLLIAVPPGGMESRVSDQQRYAPVNLNALDALGRLHEGDPEAADRSTLLLSPTEVVARFGFPNSVGTTGGNGDGTVYFQYSRPGPDGEDNFALFNFKDGFLVYYGVDMPDR